MTTIASRVRESGGSASDSPIFPVSVRVPQSQMTANRPIATRLILTDSALTGMLRHATCRVLTLPERADARFSISRYRHRLRVKRLHERMAKRNGTWCGAAGGCGLGSRQV